MWWNRETPDRRAASSRTCVPSTLVRSEEHTSELQSRFDLVCRLLLEKKNTRNVDHNFGHQVGNRGHLNILQSPWRVRYNMPVGLPYTHGAFDGDGWWCLVDRSREPP